MSISLIIRNFAGTSFTLDVDPAITTVSTLKGRISDLGKGKSAQPLVLAFKGHELRDTRQLDHYGISMQDTIHIRKHPFTLNTVVANTEIVGHFHSAAFNGN